MKNALKITGKMNTREILVQGMGGYYAPYVTSMDSIYRRQGCSNSVIYIKINEQKLIDLNKNKLELNDNYNSGLKIGKIALKGKDIKVEFLIVALWWSNEKKEFELKYALATENHWANSQKWWSLNPADLPLIGEGLVEDYYIED